MKHLFFLAMIICTVGVSCKKNKPGNVSFTSSYDFTVSIPGQPEVPVFDTAVAVSSAISFNDDRLDNCDRASLRSFYIEITEPASQTFDFAREVRLSISAPGLPEIDMVTAEHIDPNARRIDFMVDDRDLAQYLRHDEMSIKMKIVLLKGTSRAVGFYGNMVFNAQAAIL